MKYKFLPHTADIKFQAFGNSLEKAFENASYALANIICKEKIKSKEKKKIKIKGRDRENLLYNFLEEFLYLLDVGGFLVGKIENLKIIGVKSKSKYYDSELTADIFGDNAENYETETHVKAITYNDMFIKEEKKGFICQVVVDV